TTWLQSTVNCVTAVPVPDMSTLPEDNVPLNFSVRPQKLAVISQLTLDSAHASYRLTRTWCTPCTSSPGSQAIFSLFTPSSMQAALESRSNTPPSTWRVSKSIRRPSGSVTLRSKSTGVSHDKLTWIPRPPTTIAAPASVAQSMAPPM